MENLSCYTSSPTIKHCKDELSLLQNLKRELRGFIQGNNKTFDFVFCASYENISDKIRLIYDKRVPIYIEDSYENSAINLEGTKIILITNAPQWSSLNHDVIKIFPELDIKDKMSTIYRQTQENTEYKSITKKLLTGKVLVKSREEIPSENHFTYLDHRVNDLIEDGKAVHIEGINKNFSDSEEEKNIRLKKPFPFQGKHYREKLPKQNKAYQVNRVSRPRSKSDSIDFNTYNSPITPDRWCFTGTHQGVYIKSEIENTEINENYTNFHETINYDDSENTDSIASEESPDSKEANHNEEDSWG